MCVCICTVVIIVVFKIYLYDHNNKDHCNNFAQLIGTILNIFYVYVYIDIYACMYVYKLLIFNIKWNIYTCVFKQQQRINIT